MKKLFLFICSFLLLSFTNSAVCQTAIVGEAKNLEKTILHSISVPSTYASSKRANVFAIKFTFSTENRLVSVTSSKHAPEGLVKVLTQASTYSKIDWAKLRGGIGSGSLALVVSVYPDEKSGFANDKSETIPYFTHLEVDDLLNFKDNDGNKPIEVLPFTIKSAYGSVAK